MINDPPKIRLVSIFLAGCIEIGAPLLLIGLLLDNRIIISIGGMILFGGAFVVAAVSLIIAIYLLGVAVVQELNGLKEL